MRKGQGALVALENDPVQMRRAIKGLMTVGMVMAWSGAAASIPQKWLNCNGAELSREAFKELFAVIGTTYGSAGATTFTLPNPSAPFTHGLWIIRAQ